ncbi:methyltransferase domain-containing protein [Desulfoplanes sp.]
MQNESKELHNNEYPEKLISQAEKAIHESDWSKATSILQKIFLTHKDKTPPQVYVLMSIVHRMQGNLDKSEKIIKKSLCKHPNEISILIEYVKISKALNDIPEVARRLEELNSLKIIPSPSTHHKQAEISLNNRNIRKKSRICINIPENLQSKSTSGTKEQNHKQHHKHHIRNAEKLKTSIELCKKIDEILHLNFKSIVDVGCGYGYFLSVAKKIWNTQKILGIDGPWIKKEHLQISNDEFIEANLEKDIAAKKLQSYQKFDLAVSLEVGEHLEQKQAHNFIKLLTSLSDLVIFSAAIPGQEGQGHVNEKWPSYWAELFQIHNFDPLDILRGEIWHNKDIDLCLRQNIILFVNKKNNISICDASNNPLDLVHPEFYNMKQQRIHNLYIKKIIELEKKLKINT